MSFGTFRNISNISDEGFFFFAKLVNNHKFTTLSLELFLQKSCIIDALYDLSPFSANPKKWSNILKKFLRKAFPVPTPQSGQTHLQNLSERAVELF